MISIDKLKLMVYNIIIKWGCSFMEFLITKFIDTTIFLANTVGIFLIFGLLFKLLSSEIQKLEINLFGLFSYIIIYPFVVIHELAHLIMALIFTNRITEVKLLNFSNDGTLGYVSFAKVNSNFKIRNLYQNIGDFYVGLAPIIIGSGLFLITSKFINNDLFKSIIKLSEKNETIFDLLASFRNLNNLQYLFNFNLILFILIIFSISSLFLLSKSDWEGCLQGIPYLVITMFIINVFFNSFTWFVNFSKWLYFIQNTLFLTMLYIVFYSLLIYLLLKLINFIKIKREVG